MNEREKFWLRWRMGRGWLRNHLGAGEVPGETDLAGRATTATETVALPKRDTENNTTTPGEGPEGGTPSGATTETES